MHRTVVKTKEVEKITRLPDELKKFESLELLITPAQKYKKEDLKKRFADVFNKAKNIKIPDNINLDDLMNEMNDALL